MNTTSTPGRRRALITPARAAGLLLWAAAVAVLAVVDGQTAIFALAVAGHAIYLGAVAVWLLPEVVPVEADDVLRITAKGLPLVVRLLIVVAAVAFVFAYRCAVDGLYDGTPIPLLTPLVAPLQEIRLWPGVGGFELVNLASYALVPGALVLALGTRPRELGLRLPARRTVVATLVCLVPSAIYVGCRVASGQFTFAGQFFLFIHNLLSNGFSEEFQCRGLVLAHLRAFLKTDWALLGQAVVFALLHFHPNGAEEQANPLRSLAEDIALNMPIGLAFGFLALRSRSLVLPTILHMCR